VISGEIGRFWELTEAARERGAEATAAVFAAGDAGAEEAVDEDGTAPAAE
jgi:hypothetical protein